MAAPSKFIQKICYNIQVQSGLTEVDREQRTQPSLKWITERAMSEMKAIPLRTAKQTKNEEVLSLQQFNPSFLVKDGNKIHCRVPGCSATTERRESSNLNEKVKQDLFLCHEHSETLIRMVSERCAKENVIVDPERFKNEDFNGYRNLIGELEKAFTCFQTKWLPKSATDSLLAEVFLNTRNLLVITNALLNPDKDNTVTVLGPYLELFRIFLSKVDDPQFLQSMLTALKEVLDILLGFFGVIYRWVVLAKPGTRIGAGLGLVAGFAFGYSFTLARLATSLLVGTIGGGLIGSGGYDWYKEEQNIKMQQETLHNYYKLISQWFGSQDQMLPKLISVPANASGDISIVIHAEFLFQAKFKRN